METFIVYALVGINKYELNKQTLRGWYAFEHEAKSALEKCKHTYEGCIIPVKFNPQDMIEFLNKELEY